MLRNLLFMAFAGLLLGCSDQWNAPYSLEKIAENTLFSSFSSPPKHLDPVVSYNANEWSISSQILEPPLQYHFLKRPYVLEPLILEDMPQVVYLDSAGQVVDKSSEDVAYSEFALRLKEGINYAPHPAFVKNSAGDLAYLNLSAADLKSVKTPYDLPEKATRELVAQDLAYAIKRMAIRQNHSPVLDTMAQYIVGLDEFSKEVSELRGASANHEFFDLREFDLAGVGVASDYELTIRIKGIYPQFSYWLAMNFFAPIPWEALAFYSQDGLAEKNISFDTFPIGTGPFYLAENNPNRVMRLAKNAVFHPQFYPEDGLSEAMPQSLLKDAGKRLPFIDEVVFTLEKESVPYWNKFLQGYYDASGVSSDSFDQAVQISVDGALSLSDELLEREIHLRTAVEPSIFYFAFNMLDEVVGGYDSQAKKLRQAISIAINFEEFIAIFMNERGMAAQSPLPPGIFGHLEGEQGINPVVYDWKNGGAERKSLELAKELLAEAGYAGGIDPNTGRNLQLHYDAVASGPDDRARLDWMRKQFEQLGIELVIRSTDYNRFQDKVRKGDAQLFFWGWNADYPDPENFLFLLYGPNGSVKTKGAGINSANYDNPEFNRLFDEIKSMENTPERLDKLQEMLAIAREDAPWMWGLHPRSLALYHSWYQNIWPNRMANNTVKYLRVDGAKRAAMQSEWNKPVVWPLWVGVVLLVLAGLLAYQAVQRRNKL